MKRHSWKISQIPTEKNPVTVDFCKNCGVKRITDHRPEGVANFLFYTTANYPEKILGDKPKCENHG